MEIELLSQFPEADSEGRPHLLFVHGAFHGAWCWEEHYLPWFAGQGWAAHAVSLRGHGQSGGADGISNFTLDDYCDDIAGAMERIGRPVVLVGHSMGGVLSERMFHRRPDVAGLVFFASSPLKPDGAVVMRLLRTRPLSLLRGQFGGDLHALRRAMEPFFLSPDLPAAELDRYHGLLSLESPKAMAEIFPRAAAYRPDGDARPVLVVGGEDDWSIPPASHEALAARYNAPLAMCPGAHGMMLDPHWKASAQAILDWLGAAFPAG
ncbi:MAG: alpha/beta fold hydrolase [Hyphomonas sp.]|uniref:alpha/beta hydrolase n=1 Tax=Hyphomonas sp. TaxID=87 RepID=UPI003527F3F0